MPFVLGLACITIATSTVSPLAAGAARHQTLLSQRAVIKAFAKSGLALFNPEAGFMDSTITLSLESSTYPFTLGVTIYPSVAQAERSYIAGKAAWHDDGYAVAITQNIIVAVVPRGAALGRRAAKPFAMPAKVAASVARLG